MENMAVLEQEQSSTRSRRNALLMGGAALAGLAVTRGAQAQAAAITDTDILNFALNLEYLEAQYYTLATTGQTIDQLSPNPVGITSGGGAAGGTVTFKTNIGTGVKFTTPALQAYAMETAQEERNHVTFLRGALGAAAVAQPNIDLLKSFQTLGGLVGVPNFDPFSSETAFLLGAYIFEDVGVTAYLGAAPKITTTSNLIAALQIHAVEAYHAGIVRTQIFRLPTTPIATGLPSAQQVSQNISMLRQQVAGTGSPIDTGVGLVTNGVTGSGQASTIVDVDPTTAIVLGRTPAQVLSIVYGGSAGGAGNASFFPNGVNGNIK